MSITASKRQLAEAIELYDHLKLELSDNVDNYSEEEWQNRLRSLGLEAVS
jgi:transketolase